MNSKTIPIVHVNSRQPSIPLFQLVCNTFKAGTVSNRGYHFFNFIYTKIIVTTLQLTKLWEETEMKGTNQVDLKTAAAEACLV